MKTFLFFLLTLICVEIYSQNNQNSSLMGLWQMNTETIEFKTYNQVMYLGQTYQFTTEGNILSIITNQGPLQMYYSVSGNNSPCQLIISRLSIQKLIKHPLPM
jgi:hypothetical protein